MKKIKAALSRLADRLTYRQGDLKKARGPAKHFSKLAMREHLRQKDAEKAGHKLRAARFKRRAEARQKHAIYWKDRVKKDLDAIHKLTAKVEKREAEMTAWKKEHGVVFVGPNRVEGGDPHQRLEAAILAAWRNYREGTQPGYYSQEGAARDYRHAIHGYPGGHIWDCSTFADGVYICCGLEAPSGPNTERDGGWTGTQGEHGKRIREEDARPGDLVLYGPFPHHHVEVVLDPKAKTTIGHGSPPVDPGIFNLFGDGDYEIRRYVNV